MGVCVGERERGGEKEREEGRKKSLSWDKLIKTRDPSFSLIPASDYRLIKNIANSHIFSSPLLSLLSHLDS